MTERYLASDDDFEFHGKSDADWDEAAHPRVPAGEPGGGEFGAGGGGGRSGAAQGHAGSGPRAAKATEFHSAFESAFRDSPYASHVTHYSEKDLAGMKLFVSQDGKTGVAVHDHGDGRVEATALFNQGGEKGAGLKMLAHAIDHAGVNYVECYGPFLNQHYEKLGFRQVSRDKFNPEYAAKGWDQKRFDSPDYYTMRMRTEYEALKENMLGSDRADFDPDEPRDEHGRWGAGGAPGPTSKTGQKFGNTAPEPKSEPKSVAAMFAELPESGPTAGEDPHMDLPGPATTSANYDARTKAFRAQASERTQASGAEHNAILNFTRGGHGWADIRDYEKDPKNFSNTHAKQVAAWESMRAYKPEEDRKYGSAAERDSHSIDRFFDKSTPTPGFVYRGMAADDTKLSGLLTRDTITIPATSSSSRIPEVAMDFAQRHENEEGMVSRAVTPVIFRLRERSGVAIEHLSGQPQEGEVLLRKGTKFRVTGRGRAANYLILDGEEI